MASTTTVRPASPRAHKQGLFLASLTDKPQDNSAGWVTNKESPTSVLPTAAPIAGFTWGSDSFGNPRILDVVNSGTSELAVDWYTGAWNNGVRLLPESMSFPSISFLEPFDMSWEYNVYLCSDFHPHKILCNSFPTFLR